MEILSNQNFAEYEEFLKSHPKGHFMQSPQWAKVKGNWSYKVAVERNENGEIIGSIAFLIRRLPYTKYNIMYAPRGPVCDINNTELLNKLIEDAKELGKQFNACVLIIDPDVKSEETEYVKVLTDAGFKGKDGKNFEGTQPRFVFRLDVKGKTIDELMAAFHSKTRYNIRVAQKNGVEVKIVGKEEAKTFYEIMLETGMRDNFVTRPLSYFETMLDSLGENARLYMAYYEGKAIAGTLAAQYGNKVWYLYGASSNAYRNVMPNYLLQLEMIRWAVDAGCDIYDFRGVSGDLSPENPLYGLYKFKKGFSGELTEFIGEFELITKPFVYKSMQKARHILSVFTRTVYRIKNRGKKKQ
ncbi:MAG: peptidoglycan bridge formation glycyltransferase FemA/FemB family protein [Oscillospiraceae bacterium]|nr:peptidoglycan bridge formation glycyltransferase FemA/FemB family protein [Oscillospiraceae bacterium]